MWRSFPLWPSQMVSFKDCSRLKEVKWNNAVKTFFFFPHPRGILVLLNLGPIFPCLGVQITGTYQKFCNCSSWSPQGQTATCQQWLQCNPSRHLWPSFLHPLKLLYCFSQTAVVIQGVWQDSWTDLCRDWRVCSKVKNYFVKLET